jgi:malate synthase
MTANHDADRAGTQANRTAGLQIRNGLEREYADIYTAEAKAAMSALADYNGARMALMDKRIKRRADRAANQERIAFLSPDDTIAGTQISVQDARDGRFVGSEIPHDLQRQWIQGTGPAAKPNASVASSIRNVAYALLSGADGWMFDGEDALGQITAMSLDNQRNLKLAIARDPVFMQAAKQVAAEMNAWAGGFFGRDIIADWQEQLNFTTRIATAMGSRFPPPLSTWLFMWSTTMISFWMRAPRSSCTCPRSRPRRKPPCGTKC